MSGDTDDRPLVGVLLYPGCIFLEIAAAVELLAPRCRLLYATPDGTGHQASNGSLLLPQASYADLAAAPLQAVLVPGGDPGSIVTTGAARALLQTAAARGALLAGICAGALVLADAGLLRGRRGTHNYTAEFAPPEVVDFVARYWEGLRFERADLVLDDRVITAMPWAHVRFAATVARELGLLNFEQAEAHVAYHRRQHDPP